MGKGHKQIQHRGRNSSIYVEKNVQNHYKSRKQVKMTTDYHVSLSN